VKDSRQVEDWKEQHNQVDGESDRGWPKPRADLIAENLCLRQQLIVLQRRTPRPRLRDGDRRFRILVCR
jgi:hypothetical protein